MAKPNNSFKRNFPELNDRHFIILLHLSSFSAVIGIITAFVKWEDWKLTTATIGLIVLLIVSTVFLCFKSFGPVNPVYRLPGYLLYALASIELMYIGNMGNQNEKDGIKLAVLNLFGKQTFPIVIPVLLFLDSRAKGSKFRPKGSVSPKNQKNQISDQNNRTIAQNIPFLSQIGQVLISIYCCFRKEYSTNIGADVITSVLCFSFLANFFLNSLGFLNYTRVSEDRKEQENDIKVSKISKKVLASIEPEDKSIQKAQNSRISFFKRDNSIISNPVDDPQKDRDLLEDDISQDEPTGLRKQKAFLPPLHFSSSTNFLSPLDKRSKSISKVKNSSPRIQVTVVSPPSSGSNRLADRSPKQLGSPMLSCLHSQSYEFFRQLGVAGSTAKLNYLLSIQEDFSPDICFSLVPQNSSSLQREGFKIDREIFSSFSMKKKEKCMYLRQKICSREIVEIISTVNQEKNRQPPATVYQFPPFNGELKGFSPIQWKLNPSQPIIEESEGEEHSALGNSPKFNILELLPLQDNLDDLLKAIHEEFVKEPVPFQKTFFAEDSFECVSQGNLDSSTPRSICFNQESPCRKRRPPDFVEFSFELVLNAPTSQRTINKMNNNDSEQHFKFPVSECCSFEAKIIVYPNKISALEGFKEKENLENAKPYKMLLFVKVKPEEVIQQNSKELLNYISHEMRSPLLAVLGCLKLFHNKSSQEEFFLNPVFKTLSNLYLKQSEINLTTLLEACQLILEMSSDPRGSLEMKWTEFNLKKLIIDTVRIFDYQLGKNKDTSLQIEYFGEMISADLTSSQLEPVFESRTRSVSMNSKEASKPGWFMRSDPIRIKQIVINLISNALKYTIKGTVLLKIEQVNHFGKKSNSQKSFSHIKISVIDTGIGIKEPDLNKLFSAFSRIRNKEDDLLNCKGIGLGLVLSNMMSKALSPLNQAKGIQVSSEYQKGSTFSFFVQNHFSNIIEQKIMGVSAFDPNNQREIYSDIHNTKISSKRKTSLHNLQATMMMVSSFLKGSDIMVVDDSEINLEILKDMLQNLGANVHAFTDPEKALEEVEAKLEATQGRPFFDMFLLDYEMPILNGSQIALKIRELFEESELVPLLCISAQEMDEDDLKEYGFNDQIPKPISLQSLINLLTKYVCQTNRDEDLSSRPAIKFGMLSSEGKKGLSEKLISVPKQNKSGMASFALSEMNISKSVDSSKEIPVHLVSEKRLKVNPLPLHAIFSDSESVEELKKAGQNLDDIQFEKNYSKRSISLLEESIEAHPKNKAEKDLELEEVGETRKRKTHLRAEEEQIN